MKAPNKFSSWSTMTALLLQQIVTKTDRMCLEKLTTEKLRSSYKNNKFYCSIKPKMSIKSYLHRLAKYLHVSESWFVLALIYIDRLTEMHPHILVSSYTIHR